MPKNSVKWQINLQIHNFCRLIEEDINTTSF